MKNKEMTGRRVFGYGGLSGIVPCIYVDEGHYDGTRTDEVDYRIVAVATMLRNLDYETVMKIIGERPEPYGYRTQNGDTSLYCLSDDILDALIARNK